MSVRIHPTAIVDPGAELGPDVVVDAFAMIGPRVEIGAGSTIGARVSIEGRTAIGAGCSIGTGSVIGNPPQDLKYRGEPTTVRIGDDTEIREYVTINRGTIETGETVVGRRCYLMTYVHVAHDCVLGEGVVLANAVQLAGHVRIDDRAQVGGLTAVHQFVRIGRHAFVGGGSRVPRDIPPFGLTAGNPTRLYGINTEGLRRAGFPPDARLRLKQAFRLLFNSGAARGDALARLREEHGDDPDVACLLDFVESSARGVLV